MPALPQAQKLQTHEEGADARLTPPPPETATPGDEILEPPPATRIKFVRTADSVTFLMPRNGLRSREVRFLALFCVVWNVILAVLVIPVLVSGHHRIPIPALGMGATFFAVGVAMILWTIHLALRTAVILATSDALVFNQKGVWRRTETQWPRGTLATVAAGDSHTTVQNETLQQLQIRTTDRRLHRLLTGLDPADLTWIAATLRTFYALPAELPIKVSQPASSAR